MIIFRWRSVCMHTTMMHKLCLWCLYKLCGIPLKTLILNSLILNSLMEISWFFDIAILQFFPFPFKVPNWSSTWSHLLHVAGLAGAAGGVDKRCHIVVRGERQLPEICSTLTTVLNWKLPIHTYFDILKNLGIFSTKIAFFLKIKW